MRPFPIMADSKDSLATNPLFDRRVEPAILHLISKGWLINCVVLLSMTMQIILAFGGTFRHCRSNVMLQVMLWLAYMFSDAVAVYALGNMAEQSQAGLYGIFAPLLLIHLGGPDTITAYSTADNELWTRHMLTMMFQSSVAMYVIYISGLKDRLLAAAILLAFVGATKYAERTLALRCASFSQIVSSANPMYKYMSCGKGRSCQYMVMGVTQWDKEFERTAKGEKMQVDIYDVWEEEGHEATDNYMLCLSHALFKMYKRRYVNLYIHERGLPDTRRFFLGEMEIAPSTVDKLFAVIEVELKFMYDALFTKSSGTAYSKLGVVMRVVNIMILGIAGFMTLNELGKEHEFLHEALSAQRTVAYIVVVVGFLVEFSQLLRTIASDWTLVWLICTNIRLRSEGIKKQTCIELWVSKLMKLVIRVLTKVREKRKRRYWKRAISQYCIVDLCSVAYISPLIWKWSGYFHMRDLIIRWCIDSSPIEDDLKEFIVKQVKERCSPEEDIEACKAKLTSFNSSLERGNSDTGLSSSSGSDQKGENSIKRLSLFSGSDQEHLILHWHVATTICEMEYSMDDSKDEDLKKYFNRSKKLSRYCAYLLVLRPKLLPLHPDIAKMEYMKLHNDLVHFCLSNSKTTLKDSARNPHGCDGYNYGSTFRNGVELANNLLEIGRENKQRLWEVIAHHWAEVLIYYAVFGKSTVHAEYLTVGGEFLTHLWVLIGHMGCGDQN